MILNKVEASGFGPYDDISVSLQEGVYGLLGKNGHGKSSFFDILRYGFFEHSREGDLSKIANRYLHPKKDPSVKIAFCINSIPYEIVRGRKLFNSSGDKLRVERSFAELRLVGKDIPIAVGEAVKKEIINLSGMTERVFLNTSFFQQDMQDEFLTARPSDRVSFIQEYFDLSVFGRAQKEEKVIVSDLKIQLSNREGALETVEETLETVNIQQVKKRLETVDEDLQRCTVTYDEFLQQVETFNAAQKDRQSYLAKKKQHLHVTALIASLREDKLGLERHEEEYSDTVLSKKIEEFVAKEADLRDAKQVMDQVLGQYHNAFDLFQESIDMLEAIEDVSQCPVCTTTLGKEKAADLLLEFKGKQRKVSADRQEQIKVIKIKTENINKTLVQRKTAEKELADYHRVRDKVKSIDEQVVIYTKNQTSLQTEMTQLKSKWAAASVPKLEKVDITTHTKELSDKKSEVSGRKQTLAQEVKSYSEAKVKHTKLKRDISVLNRDMEIHEILVQAFDKYGAPNDITEIIIKMIEDYSNDELSRLNSNMVVRFDNFVTMKRSTKPGIEIWIHDKGESAKYKSYSGGEKSLINFAVRIGMSQTLQTLTGVTTSSLLLDEVMGKLDEDNRSSMVRVVQSLRTKFKQVFFITHTELKREFDAVLEFVKDEQGISRLVT